MHCMPAFLTALLCIWMTYRSFLGMVFEKSTFPEGVLMQPAGRLLLRAEAFALFCRCNFDERQRATWVRIANEGSHRGPVFVMGLHLDLPLGLCIQRAEARAEHPTLNGDDVADVIHRLILLCLAQTVHLWCMHSPRFSAVHVPIECQVQTLQAALRCSTMLMVSSVPVFCIITLSDVMLVSFSLWPKQVQRDVPEGNKAGRFQRDILGSQATGHRQFCAVRWASNELPASLFHASLWHPRPASRLLPQPHCSASRSSTGAARHETPCTVPISPSRPPQHKGQFSAAAPCRAGGAWPKAASLQYCSFPQNAQCRWCQY